MPNLVHTDNPWVLQGLLVCGVCMGAMHPCGPNINDRSDMRVRAYTCTDCTTPPVNAEAVELEVWRRCCATDPNAEHLGPGHRHSYIHNEFARILWTGAVGRSMLVRHPLPRPEFRLPAPATAAVPVGGASASPPPSGAAVGRAAVTYVLEGEVNT